MAKSIPAALAAYRTLSREERPHYMPPAGKAGAPAIHKLKEIAEHLCAARKFESLSPSRLYLLRCAQRLAKRPVFVEATARPPSPQQRLIPLSAADRQRWQAIAEKQFPRRRNWVSAVETLSAPKKFVRTIDEGHYKGRASRYTCYSYRPQVQAMGRVSPDGLVLGAMVAGTPYTLLAPRGYQWDGDALGIRLLRLRDQADYHLDSSDVRGPVRAIVAKLRERAAVRAALARTTRHAAAALKKAIKAGVWVSFADSTAAGNCTAGTLAYANQFHLNPRTHYRAEQLPVPPEYRSRVALTVTAALRRQAAEARAGFCQLATT